MSAPVHAQNNMDDDDDIIDMGDIDRDPMPRFSHEKQIPHANLPFKKAYDQVSSKRAKDRFGFPVRTYVAKDKDGNPMQLTMNELHDRRVSRPIAPEHIKDAMEALMATLACPPDMPVRDHAYDVLGFDYTDSQAIQPTLIERHAALATFQVVRLQMEFVNLGLAGEQEKDGTNTNHFNYALDLITTYKDLLMNEQYARALLENRTVALPIQQSLFKFSPMSYADLKPHQKFLLFILHCLARDSCRIYNKTLYTEIKTSDGIGTTAWKKYMELEEYVYKRTDKETHGERWIDMTSGPTNIPFVLGNVCESNHAECPRLVVDRRKFAFRNGIFMAGSEPVFVKYADLRPTSKAAAKYFNLDFEIERWNEISGNTSWYDVPTPRFDSIFTYQGLEPDVIKVIYGMLGRMMYEVGECDENENLVSDDFQVLLFLKGVAGCGKSTVIRVIMNLYERDQIGLISSNIEVKFGLSTVAKKLLFACPEVKSPFNLPQSDLQSVISGERVSLAVKNKEPFDGKWTSPGIFAGNEIADWIDASGSMRRRLLMVVMPKVVREMDAHLYSDILKEYAALIYKMTHAYNELRTIAGSRSIWASIPKYFTEKQDELAESINPLIGFLKSENVVLVVNAPQDSYVPYTDFWNRHNEYIKTHLGRHAPTINADYYRTTFDAYGISVIHKATKIYGGSPRTGAWIVGVRFPDMIDSSVSMDPDRV